jgi:hypothetical protein
VITPEAAQALLDDDTFKTVTEDLQGELMSEIANTEPLQQAKRESAYFQLKAVGLILMRLEVTAAGGAILRAKEENRKLMS